ncbi:MAG: Hsp33 family molecular chaperone HslO [Firmicutes bacterium]|nr:Hsp33 family molecular chaperone HslO [Bacillota bacterium]
MQTGREARLPGPWQDYRVRATAAGGAVRAVAALVTKSALTAQELHAATPVAAAAMGRLLAAAALLAADFKTRFRLTVSVNGGGPAGMVQAQAETGGELRARIEHPDVELPLRPDGKLAVGQAVGNRGSLSVTVVDRESDQVYRSEVELVTGEIAEDLTRYYLQSEQVPSAVALGVLVGRSGLVAAAGGLVVQLLPDAPAGLGDLLADRVEALGAVSRRLAAGARPEDLLEALLPGPVHYFPPERLAYSCHCGPVRSRDILAALPASELEALISEGGAEVTCPYCRRSYRFPAAELERLRRERP